MTEKKKDIAKELLLVPSKRPMAVVSAVTCGRAAAVRRRAQRRRRRRLPRARPPDPSSSAHRGGV